MRVSKFFYSIVVPVFCLGSGGLTQAADPGIAYDAGGSVVKDGYGDCVRTAWPDGQVPPDCGGKVVVQQAPPPRAEVVKREVAAPAEDSRRLKIGGTSFDTNKYVLNKQGKRAMDRAVREIRSTPNVQRIHVVGHTDNVGGEIKNQLLSQRRAESVRSYLQSKGLRNITAEGVGASQPTTPGSNATAKGRSANRRVEIIINPR
ncbi:OmpA-OmpF porin, OOP family [Gammaproteobacteria bacterium]